MVDSSLRKLDKSNMYLTIYNFFEQILKGIEIGEAADLKNLSGRSFTDIVVSGMGGSAIGGELLRSYLRTELKIPMTIHRNYNLPEHVTGNSLVICSSYSGDTEETLSAYVKAKERGCSLLCISTNGKLAEQARADNFALVKIPTGMMPREALGYSFTPLLKIFSRLGLCRDHSAELLKCGQNLKAWAEEYSFETPDNKAYELASRLKGKTVIIYAGPDYFDAVGLRFKGQICENAKQLAFFNVFPEFNHNELVGWELSTSFADNYMVIMLRDEIDHPRIASRMNIVKGLIFEKGVEVIELYSKKGDLLSRMFSQIQFGDFVSYYLALMNGIDPTPIYMIDYLKNELSRE